MCVCVYYYIYCIMWWFNVQPLLLQTRRELTFFLGGKYLVKIVRFLSVWSLRWCVFSGSNCVWVFAHHEGGKLRCQIHDRRRDTQTAAAAAFSRRKKNEWMFWTRSTGYLDAQRPSMGFSLDCCSPGKNEIMRTQTAVGDDLVAARARANTDSNNNDDDLFPRFFRLNPNSWRSTIKKCAWLHSFSVHNAGLQKTHKKWTKFLHSRGFPEKSTENVYNIKKMQHALHPV